MEELLLSFATLCLLHYFINHEFHYLFYNGFIYLVSLFVCLSAMIGSCNNLNYSIQAPSKFSLKPTDQSICTQIDKQDLANVFRLVLMQVFKLSIQVQVDLCETCIELVQCNSSFIISREKMLKNQNICYMLI